MGEHTATPWQAVAGKTAGQEVISLAAVSKSRHVVGRFGGPDREANARLFVAAPGLLEALQEACRYLAYLEGETDNVFVGPGTPREALTIARAAIAKATPPDTQGA